MAQPAARPKPTPPANPGVLTPEERRARLLDAAPPDGFTSEWAGGPAILKLDANELARGRADHRRVALTFDGCYDASTVPAMLELLRAQHVRVTFFLTGIFARQFPAAVRQIAAAGHEIGNHSYDHPYFTRGSDAADLRQVERAEQLLSPLAGSAYRPYFRPPYGDRNLRVLRLLLRQGYLPVYWTVDTLDWQKEATPETVLAKVEAKGLRPGSIILMHVGSRASLRALPQLLTRLRAAGLEPGPLAGVLAR